MFQKHVFSHKTVVVVAGPTASGKSAFALKEASQNSGIIINGDSQQLFQGLPVLTAQPSQEDLLQLPHHLYEVYPYNHQGHSVITWTEHAHTLIKEAHRKKMIPWIVGGTGFYLETFMKGMSPLPAFPPEDQESFRCTLKDVSTPLLYENLQKKDPVFSAKISFNDRQRILRGLFIFHATGRALSSFYAHAHDVPPYDFYRIYLAPSREQLLKSITRRWSQMKERGVLEEVQNFSARPSYHTSPLCKAIGFQEILLYIQGHISEETLQTLYFQKTCQYAKRQRCWFSHRFFPHCTIS